jgi:hypothetical protein
MKTPHYDVVIATPGSSMKAEYVKSLVQTLRWLSEEGLSYHYINRYSSFVSYAREKTATDSAESNWDATEIADGAFTYDKLLWIDSDIVWEPETVKRLMSGTEKLDVVSAMVPVNISGAITAMRLDSELLPVQLTWTDLIMDEEPVEVDGVGFGMVMFRYGVFERTPRPWFQIRKTNIRGVPFPVDYGEDYSACIGMKKAGFKIWLDPLAKVQHIKEHLLT